MKRLTKNQQGFGVLAILFVLVVLGVAVVVGLRVANPSGSLTSSLTGGTEKKIPTKINSASDVQKAANALDSTNVESDVNPNSLDKDLNSVL